MQPPKLAISSRSEKPTLHEPTQWRELLSHSLSTMSVESNDSTLSSGYLARRRSQDSTLEEPGKPGGPSLVRLESTVPETYDSALGQLVRITDSYECLA